MNLGKVTEVRESAGFTRSQLSDLLLVKGFDVKPHYRQMGDRYINPEAFLAICDICKGVLFNRLRAKISMAIRYSVSAGCNYPDNRL